MTPSPHTITDLENLRELCGEPHSHTPYKVQTQLTEQARAFVRQSPFVMLSTLDANGEPTISPKGGEPGFIGLDEDTFYLPDRKGNNLIFSLQNILEHPQVGLIFLLPGTCETLRVHGNAQISRNPELCMRYKTGTKPARLVTIIKLTTYYFHCSMSLRTAKLWEPETWRETVKISWKEEIEPNLPDADAKLDGDF